MGWVIWALGCSINAPAKDSGVAEDCVELSPEEANDARQLSWCAWAVECGHSGYDSIDVCVADRSRYGADLEWCDWSAYDACGAEACLVDLAADPPTCDEGFPRWEDCHAAFTDLGCADIN